MSGRPLQSDLDDLVLRLKGLVYVRALLEARGAPGPEVEEHTAEIERVRSRLAELVRESPARYGVAA